MSLGSIHFARSIVVVKNVIAIVILYTGMGISQEISSIEPMDECPISSVELSWKFNYINRAGLPKQMDIHLRQTPHVLVAQVLQDNKKELYVFKDRVQYVEIGEHHVPRQLALHHLRERVMGSPLSIEDFKILRSKSYFCPRKVEQDSLFFADSLVSYSKLESLPENEGYRFYNYRWKSWKNWRFKSPKEIDFQAKKYFIPTLIDVDMESNWGHLELQSLRINRKLISLDDSVSISFQLLTTQNREVIN